MKTSYKIEEMQEMASFITFCDLKMIAFRLGEHPVSVDDVMKGLS